MDEGSPPPQLHPQEFNMDIIYVGMTLALVVLSVGFIALCERL